MGRMKLNSLLTAKSGDRKVRIAIQVEGDGKYESANVRHRAAKLTNEVHAILAAHFCVKDIKVK